MLMPLLLAAPPLLLAAPPLLLAAPPLSASPPAKTAPLAPVDDAQRPGADDAVDPQRTDTPERLLCRHLPSRRLHDTTHHCSTQTCCGDAAAVTVANATVRTG
ncbi:hypothetical protein Vafri_19798, partial [Volvox africanus]